MEEDVPPDKHVELDRGSSQRHDSRSSNSDITIGTKSSRERQEEMLLALHNDEYIALYMESQRELAEQTELFQKRLIMLTCDYDEIKEKYDIGLQADESVRTSNLFIKMDNENMFHMKPKRTKGNSKCPDTEAVKCVYTGCSNDNVDLIKCNTCGKSVCEECNDVAISKLKIIMNKCQTLYFVCKNCDKMLRDTPESIHDKHLGKVKSLEIELVEKSAAAAKHIETKYVKDLKDSYVQTNNGTCDQLNMHTSNETLTVQESLGEKIQEHARINGDNNG